MAKRSRPKEHRRRLSSGKKITINKGRKKHSTSKKVKSYLKVLNKKETNYGAFFHGTSEESLSQMALTGGLQPSNDKLYLTKEPNYARFRARQATKGTGFKPVIIEVDDPGDLKSEGRHFFSQKKVPLKKFKKVHVGDYQ